MTTASPGPGSLKVESSIDGDVGSISLHGELDLAGAGQLESSLHAAEQRRPGRLIIDLSDLHFIDSTGLRLLLAAASRAAEDGWELVLRPGRPAVQRVFEVTGALEVLRFEDASGV